ncbi:T9SS type A sorting domain-containing protein [bacterium]|nr:T9SS type A sorting domain-containing protein [bacterium]
MKKSTVIFLFVSLIAFCVIEQSFARNAVRFNRENLERIEIPDSETLDIEGQAITLEAWIKAPELEHIEQTFLNKENSYELKVDRGTVSVAIMAEFGPEPWGWEWLGYAEIRENEWEHVAATYDGEYVRVYVNGEECSADTLRGDIQPSDSSLFFGNRPILEFDRPYNGDLDEVRIWNIVRSPEEINETMNVLLTGEEDGLVGYWRFDEGEGQEVHDLSPNQNNGFFGTEEGEDDEDPTWVESDAPVYGGIIEFSPQQFSIPPIAGGEVVEEALILSNIAEDDDFNVISFDITYEDEQADWLSVDPLDGEINPDEEVEVTISINTEEIETGEYNSNLMLSCNAVNLHSTIIPVSMVVVEGSGRLFGQVTSLATGEPVENALVNILDYDLETLTDDEGNYEFNDIGAFTYDMIVTVDNFVDCEGNDVSVEDEADVEQNFLLLHREFTPNEDHIELIMTVDDSLTTYLTIENNGTAAVNWEAELVIPDSIFNRPIIYNLFEQAYDSLQWVLFMNDCFYFSYERFGLVLNREWDIVAEFELPGEQKDAASDGQLIWMARGQIISVLNIDGFDIIRDFEGPHENTTAITWDSEREILWTSGTDTDIIGIDTDGNVVDTIQNRGFEIRGLAFHPEDTNGFQLCILHVVNENPKLHKLNIENGDTLAVNLPLLSGDVPPTSAFIGNQYNADRWELIAAFGNPEYYCRSWFGIWDLEANSGWVTVEPDSGEIADSSETELTLIFDTHELLSADYHADLLFHHNAPGGEVSIPIDLTVNPSDIDKEKKVFQPSQFSISEVYPNPFNSLTYITYEVPEVSSISVKVYDLAGRIVTTLVNSEHKAGTFTTAWNARDAASGVYLIRMQADRFSQTKKLLLIR